MIAPTRERQSHPRPGSPPTSRPSPGPATVLRWARRREACSSSSSFLAGLVDEFGEAVQLLVREFLARQVEQRGDGLSGRALEERLDELFEGRSPRLLARDRWQEDIARPLRRVPQVALVFEHS